MSKNPSNGTLSHRCALVTGAKTGIGLAIAQSLAAAGASVVIGSRSADEWPQANSLFDKPVLPLNDKSASVKTSAIYIGSLEIRDQTSVEQFTQQARQRVGSIDILVNAAGVTVVEEVYDHSDSAWESVIDTNLNGAFRMIRAVLPQMIERHHGRIVNIGSTAATVGDTGSAAYCASKAGLLGLTRCVALEGAPHGVSCTMVSPTWVDTPMMHNSMAQMVQNNPAINSVKEAMASVANENPQNRVIQSHEVASLVTYLCSDEALAITMENIQVTGGAIW